MQMPQDMLDFLKFYPADMLPAVAEHGAVNDQQHERQLFCALSTQRSS